MEQTVHYFERQTPMKQKKMKIKNVAIYLILTLSLSLSIEVSLLLSQQTKDPAEEMDYVSQDTNVLTSNSSSYPGANEFQSVPTTNM